MFIARLRPALAGLMLVVFASVASAQDKPTLTATVNGSTVSLNWTVVPGATTYELLAQVGGSQFGPFSVGSGTSADIPVYLRDPTSCKSEALRGRSRGRFPIR